MKRIIILAVIVIMALSLFSCGGKRVELTTDNIDQYLDISAVVKDSDVEAVPASIYGAYYKNYEGDATVELQVVNQSGAKFENVEIECELYTHVDLFPICCGWEFDSGNVNSGTSSNSDKNSKRVRIVLPYDGNWRDTENLTLEIYEGGSMDPSELSSCYVKILSVSGTAVGGKPQKTNSDIGSVESEGITAAPVE